jgi:hypothetical protein
MTKTRRRRRRKTPRELWWLPGVIVLLGLIVAGAGVRMLPGSPSAAEAVTPFDSTAAPSAPSKPSPTPTPKPLIVRPAEVNVPASGWYSWALLDQRTGKIYGSTDDNYTAANMSEPSTTASLIKAWIAADYLRLMAGKGLTPSDARMQQLRIMIRDSDNEAAQSLWLEEVGGIKSTMRLIDKCGLTDSKANSNWSNTLLSARDTARMGACIADGRAAGKKWTNWLLGEMRAVRGVGDFGIRKAFPASVAKTIAIKNGWVTRSATAEWHVNCLAIGDGWTMGVMTQYQALAAYNYTYGADTCKQVAQQLKR